MAPLAVLHVLCMDKHAYHHCMKPTLVFAQHTQHEARGKACNIPAWLPLHSSSPHNTALLPSTPAASNDISLP